MNIRLFVALLIVVQSFSCNPPKVTEKGKGKLFNKTTMANNKGSYSFLPTSVMTIIDSVPMVEIQGGSYSPLFGRKDSSISVKDFSMDAYPVTKLKYLEFVKQNPQWQRNNTKRIFADAHYLSDWENDTILGKDINPNSPVTNVSWFAANAYCDCVGKQLPTLNQWEYVARADSLSMNATNKKSYNENIISWYETSNTNKNSIGKTQQNYWGLWDIHGLVWEWTLDFNEVMLSGESRRDVTNDNNKFCGSGSVGANDLRNYAAFMRYAFRGSLKANYCIKNQGFRCVKKDKNVIQ